MDKKIGIRLNARDRVLRAWENSVETVRDFEGYAGEPWLGEELSKMFSEFAEDEARHAARLLEILRGMG